MHLKKIPIPKFHFLLLLLTLLNCACAPARMYVGDELPKEKIAIIKASGSHPFYSNRSVHVYIVAVDDKKSRGSRAIEILPGFHKVTLLIVALHLAGMGPDIENIIDPVGPSFDFRYTLEFNAEAGHEYRIRPVDIWKKKNSFLMIVDTLSGKEVLRERIK